MNTPAHAQQMYDSNLKSFFSTFNSILVGGLVSFICHQQEELYNRLEELQERTFALPLQPLRWERLYLKHSEHTT